MNKSELFLDALIAYHTEPVIAKRLGVTKLTQNNKKQMIRMLDHLLPAVLGNNMHALTNRLSAISYSLTQANDRFHVTINGDRKYHSGFTIYNDSLQVVEVLEKGSNLNVNERGFAPISTVMLTPSAHTILNKLFNTEITEIKQEKAMDKIESQVRALNIKALEASRFCKRHIDKFTEDLNELNDALDKFNAGMFIADEDLPLVREIEQSIKDLNELLYILTPSVSYYIEHACDSSIELMYNFRKETKSADDIDWWISKLTNNLNEYHDYVNSYYAVEPEVKIDAIREITLPVHVNMLSLELKKQELESKLMQLQYESNPWTPEQRIDVKESIHIINDLIKNVKMCTVHDNCGVCDYNYMSKDDSCGRLYNGLSLQNVKKEIRYAAIPAGYMTDMNAAVFSIMRYISKAIKPSATFPIIDTYLENKDLVRSTLAELIYDYNNNVPEYIKLNNVKQALTAISFGARLVCTVKSNGEAFQSIGKIFQIDKYNGINKQACENFIKNEYVNKLHEEYMEMSNLMKEHYKGTDVDILGGYPFSKTKDTQLMAHIYQGYESKILRYILQNIMERDGISGCPLNINKSVLPLHDGLYTNWELDACMLKAAIKHAFTDLPEVPEEYYPTFESTKIYNKEVLDVVGTMQANELVNHMRRMAEAERLARNYQPMLVH